VRSTRGPAFFRHHATDLEGSPLALSGTWLADSDPVRQLSTQTVHPTGEIASHEAVIAGSGHVRSPSAADGRMNCSGDITKCVEPSPQAVFSLGTTFPAALVCTR